MKRLAFNGGELAPELALRSDLDVYARGCACIENFDVSQMGGVSRRRGMRPFVAAQPTVSRLFVFEYTTAFRYLIELSCSLIRVFDSAGSLAFESAASYADPFAVRASQLNALMLFVAPDCPVMQLRLNSYNEWSFSEYEYKNIPWRYYDYRDSEVSVSRASNGAYDVSFDASLAPIERQCCAGDLLRVSYWTEKQEASASASSLLGSVRQVSSLSASSSFALGAKIAVRGDAVTEYYSCIADWTGSDAFVSGLIHPANYSGCFIRAEAVSNGASLSSISALSEDLSFKKGDMLAFVSGYWEFFTCVKAFSPSDFVSGCSSFADYAGFFVRGLAVGSALPSKGTWKFACSGGWIGEYEVRRNPESSSLSSDWETLGSSFSPIGANVNTAITGDESEEECYLRLFITRSYYLGENIKDGFPQDYCGNKLVVDSYKHNLILRYNLSSDGSTSSASWSRVDPIPISFYGSISSKDWSWQAFSSKYGFPSLIETYGKRLVLAATKDQPVTVWMSKTDDLNNFEIGSTDDSGIALTIAAKTQNPICWLMARSEKIYLGTTDAEHVIAPSSGKIATPTNLTIENHGYIGSANIPALTASDKVIYCERGSGRIYQFGYHYESDAYVSRDLTVFADHILRQGGGVRDASYMKKPDAKAIFTLNDGTVALMTYNSMHEVNAWHRYTTQGSVESCAVMPNGELSDSLFFIVSRNGKRYIEVIDDSSPFIDGGSYNYTSTIATNAITIPDARAEKSNTPAVFFYLAEQTPTAGIEVSCDAETWKPLDRYAPSLAKGWQEMIASGCWRWESSLALRVSGNRSLRILAMQR